MNAFSLCMPFSKDNIENTLICHVGTNLTSKTSIYEDSSIIIVSREYKMLYLLDWCGISNSNIPDS